MLEFKISINNGLEVAINEPIGFDGVDLNLTRSEELYGVSSSFAGSDIQIELNEARHGEVFLDILNEYKNKGFNAIITLIIYYDSSILFQGDFDFSTTETNLIDYIRVQAIAKDKLYYLQKNKSLNVDVFSDKGLDNQTHDIVSTSSLSLPPIKLYKESIWENQSTYAYYAGVATSGSGGHFVFNNVKKQTKDDIRDSLNWLEIWKPYTPENINNTKLISAKENLTDVVVDIDIQGAFVGDPLLGNYNARLIIMYGNEDGDWFNNATRYILVNKTVDKDVPLNNVSFNNIVIVSDLPRGSAIWLYWEITTFSAGAVTYVNQPSSVKVTGYATTYYSSLNAIKYKDLVSNVIKKASNISNVVWNLNYYNNTLAFNGNLLRRLDDQPFYIKWEDIVKQFGERNLGCYYNESNDTLYIDHKNNILGNKKIMDLGDLAKLDAFNIQEDSKYVINKFSYKYSKYQALKENSVEGNRGSVHGESEWHVPNKGYEGSISVDLPLVRDSFLIEEIRIKSIEYKEDTKTNEDDTICLIEVSDNTPKKQVTEIMNLQGAYDSQSAIQTFKNDGSFSFIRIGFDSATTIEINGDEFYLLSFDDTTIELTYVGVTQPTIYNGVLNVEVKYRLMSDYIGKVDDEKINQDFSLRQNIVYWKETLSTCTFYTKSQIENTMYKENKDAVIKGLPETQSIYYMSPIIKPRIYETKIKITVDEYNTLKNNKIGYITIKNAKNEDIDIYISDISATFLNNCDEMLATITGWEKVDNNGFFVIAKNYINGFYYNNLTFTFNDLLQSVNVYENGLIIHSGLKAPYICRPFPYNCFTDYLSAKNYLLSL